MSEQVIRTEQQEKLTRNNIFLALALGAIALLALASTFYFFLNSTVTVPS